MFFSIDYFPSVKIKKVNIITNWNYRSATFSPLPFSLKKQKTLFFNKNPLYILRFAIILVFISKFASLCFYSRQLPRIIGGQCQIWCFTKILILNLEKGRVHNKTLGTFQIGVDNNPPLLNLKKIFGYLHKETCKMHLFSTLS